ncbi:MAG TPA: glycosyltransferase WbuB [Thiolapillus brandeum]|uniref:Glycosyltransferase WbuB n=1 Tax=Thiolapillus brandeum TaxID=1076588 RepID=A0A831RSZ7_9GAMM|nr:glycosyltransferase WbuB [Thiolapillus brandeum]
MKIIFINRYFFPDHSATSQLLGDLAFDLAGGDVRVMVISSRQIYDDPAARLPAREQIRGVDVSRVWTSSFGRAALVGRAIDYITFYFSVLIRLLLEAGKGDIIVAKTDPPLISVVACFAAKRKGANLVNWVQDLFPEVAVELGVGFLRGRLGRVLQRVRNYSLQQARWNVVLGKRMRNRLIDEGIAAERVTIINNWSDAEAVYPVDRNRNRLRKQWGLSGKFVLGYSGNMGRAHEFDVILDAAELLRERKDIVFLFIGDGAKRPWIEEQISARRMTNVILKPYQPRADLAESLSVPDVHFISLKPELEGLIVPSKYYGIAAAGRPAVFAGAPEGEIAGMLRDSGGGVTVGSNDARSLAKVISSLSETPEQCEQMGANARHAFDHRYGMERSIRKWREVLGFAQPTGDIPGTE